jgi:hypothetical protein
MLPSKVVDCVPYVWVAREFISIVPLLRSLNPTQDQKGRHTATLRAWEEEYRLLLASDRATLATRLEVWIASKLVWKESRADVRSSTFPLRKVSPVAFNR